MGIAKRLSFGSLRPLSDDADLPSKSHSVASLTPAPQSSRVTPDITDQSVIDDLEGITLEFFEPQEAGEPCPTNTHVEEITDAPEDQEVAQHSSRWSSEDETVLGEGKANYVCSF